jgi:tRNA dimethylallyltransferase
MLTGESSLSQTVEVQVLDIDLDNTVIVVAGPTASGKSSLAIALAEFYGGEIVNADSMQVYKEFAVLTARPSKDDEKRVPHHLYGVMSAAEPCSAGHWLEMAVPCIEDIRARGQLPIVCGGTGLYLRVLGEGIAPVPDIPTGVLNEAASLYDQIGGPAFRERLALVDPEGAATLEPGDRQRLIRAYSVYQATGRTLRGWQVDQNPEPPLDVRIFTIHLIPPRDQLYARIEARFDQMIVEGAMAEVEAVQKQILDPNLPALKALGVPDFERYLAGNTSLEEAIAKAKQGTRNFAKRQLTWFRNQSDADLLIEDFGGEASFDKVRTTLGQG